MVLRLLPLIISFSYSLKYKYIENIFSIISSELYLTSANYLSIEYGYSYFDFLGSNPVQVFFFAERVFVFFWGEKQSVSLRKQWKKLVKNLWKIIEDIIPAKFQWISLIFTKGNIWIFPSGSLGGIRMQQSTHTNWQWSISNAIFSKDCAIH